MIKQFIFSIFCFVQIFVFAQNAQFNDVDIPNPQNPAKLVNDFAHFLSPTEIELLEQKLVAYNDSTSTQITIVSVDNIGEYAIDDYAIRLGRKWKIGRKEKNNGLLILLVKQTHGIDIEVGYGLESFISDRDAKEIINQDIIPNFKNAQYYNGLNQATDHATALLNGTYTNDTTANEGIPLWVIIIIILIFIIIISKSSGKNNGGYTISGGGWNWVGGGGGNWSGGGGGSSGGGFGGFGGGSFGGGGASGNW